MEHNHILTEHSVFRLAAVNYHWTFIVSSSMVFSCPNRDTFCFENVDHRVVAVVLNNLICALSNLSLSVELEAAAKHDNLALVLDCWVALSPLNHLLWVEWHFLPRDGITHNLCSRYILNRLVVHSANHEHRLSTLGYCCALAGWRHPCFACRLSSDFYSEAFSLLHSLHVTLNASRQLFCELVSGNVFRWVGSEGSTGFIVWTFRLDKQ